MEKEKKSMCEFKRKNNYKQETIEKIICEKNKHNDILFIPNKDCVKGYYRGLVLFEKITDNCWNLVKRCKKEWTDDNESKILDEIGKGMPKDKERRTQQIIALNNMSFSKGRYSVCGFETTISTHDIYIENKKGGPEIDLVVVKPATKSEEGHILFVEYKCKGESMLKGNQNIENHYSDYEHILNSDKIEVIKKEMLKSYGMLCELNGKKAKEEELDEKKYKAQIAFLFVDKVMGPDGVIESQITPSQYEIAYNMLVEKGIDLEKVLYIRCDKPEKVNLDKWYPIKGSGLKLTSK